MSEQTAITWCDSTFNPWIGCTKVSPACDNCYAERLMDHRMRKVQWGAGHERKRTSVANWRQPLAWSSKRFMQCEDCGWRGEAECALVGCGACGSIELSDTRRRVFCASLADVFDNEVDEAWRLDLFRLILKTPHLDWLLLTKRIGNARSMIAVTMCQLDPAAEHPVPLPNVWLGATICNQEEADRDIPKLMAAPAAKRFLSIEPMLGPISMRWLAAFPENAPNSAQSHTGRTDHLDGLRRLDWVICGGESGPHARPMHPDWVRALRDECAEAGVAFHFKQWGEWAPYNRGRTDGATLATPHSLDNPLQRFGTKAAGRLLDGVEHNGVPATALAAYANAVEATHPQLAIMSEMSADDTAAKCPRCGAEMRPGIAIAQTYIGYGSGDVVTWSPGGPGLLVTCLKCVACGHSVTAADTAALCAPLAQA